MLRGILEEHGLVNDNVAKPSEVSGAEAEAYYESHGRPGDEKWVKMMNEGNAAFDKLDAQYGDAA